MIILPKFYQKCFQNLLTPTQYKRVSFFLEDLQVTKQQGFSQFNLAGYYPRKYRGKVEPSGWYLLLTNLSSLKAALKAFKQRSGALPSMPALRKTE